MQSSEAPRVAPEEVLAITRNFDAPPALLFRLWSSPEHIARWWGPETCWLETIEMDFREGGRWHFWMRNDAGLDHHISGTYRRIEPPGRLSFTYINAYDGHEMIVDLVFTALEPGRTEMRFRQASFRTLAERDGHAEGWSSTFDLLAAYLQQVDVGGDPKGSARRDGTAPDIVAARAEQAAWWKKGRAGPLAPLMEDGQ